MRHALCTLALLATIVVGHCFQPQSNITRGIYCHPGAAMSSSVWVAFRSAGEFVADERHEGAFSLRCDNRGGAVGSGCGMSQTVQIGQTEPRPLRIAGWSKAAEVAGERDWQYSLYVDLTYADGTPWAMQLATFETGTHDWQFSETVINPEKPVASASFHAFIREKPGLVWFDDLFFGEAGGPNLLRNSGFEADDRVDLSAREALAGRYHDLNANAMHIYLSPNSPLWESELLDKHFEGPSPLQEFLEAMAASGIGVWATPGSLSQPFSGVEDPRFPAYYCPNSRWGDNWVKVLGDLARNDLAGVSLTPDEYNYHNSGLKEGMSKSRDEAVRAFYENLPNYCDCPDCRRLFRERYGKDLPDLKTPDQSEAWRQYINFRYQTTTDWLRRSAEAVKQANPDCRADSLICVSPVCSDRWWSIGVAWDQVGYGTQIDFLTTDPYIELHNYLGDSTHWYVTETAERLSGAHPKRQCGIVLEASRLRQEFRELDPVEVYGSALTAVFHGAKELAWWHYSHITGTGAAAEPEKSYALVKGTYGLLGQVDPWLSGLQPEKRIALLHSRASEDWWRVYSEGDPSPVLTHAGKDARYASRAQVEVLMHCLRRSIPVDLYYLESVREEQLADYPVIVVPFAFAISDEQAAMLRELVASGKHLVVISEVGTVDEEGTIRERPALLDLLGLRQAPSGEQAGSLLSAETKEPIPWGEGGQFSVYGEVQLSAGATPWAEVNGVPALVYHGIGEGGVTFMAGEFGIGLPESYDNEIKGRLQRVYPPKLSGAHDRLLCGLYGELSQTQAAIASAKVTYDGAPPAFADDVEIVRASNTAGDLILLCTNWTEGTAELAPAVDDGEWDVAAAEGRAIGPDAEVRPLTGLPTSLAAQEACVLRVPRRGR